MEYAFTGFHDVLDPGSDFLAHLRGIFSKNTAAFECLPVTNLFAKVRENNPLTNWFAGVCAGHAQHQT